MKRRTRGSNLATLLTLFLAGMVVLAIPAAAATWSSAGNMAIDRLGHNATLLADGRVLVTGGNSQLAGNGGYDTTSAEIYDPSTNIWSATGSTASGRDQSTAARLADGTVLVAGGVNANICTNDVTTELYDPSSATWSSSGNLSLARARATATRLSDGRVLLVGGGNRCGGVFSSTEVYDPATGTWSPTGSMTTGREGHSAVRLLDGRVLAAGGAGPTFQTLSSAEIYDPATGTWTPTGSMGTERCCGGSPFLTLLADGRVLAAGGYSGFGNNINPNGPQTETYDPATGVWTPSGNMSVGRGGATLSLLTDGTVLAAGGYDGATTTTQSSAELWDPATGTWSLTGSLASGRISHTSTVLANGDVLVAGGYFENPRSYLTSAELYEVTQEVSIDIKPEGFPNPINTAKKGVIPVAVLSTTTFDASTVDSSTVCFGDIPENSGDCTVAPGTKLEDVNGDTILDLVLHFNTEQTGIDPGDTQACLTGELFDTTQIEGCDSVKTK